MPDRTQHQSTNEMRKARELSLEPTRPPAQVPGYKIRKFLGSGAYGEVWSATDLKTGIRVAIKFYTRRSSADVRLLAREVEKLVVLAADRYVVQLRDVGWDANPPYYVMDYIEHGSLEDRLSSGETLPAAEAIELFEEVATGMMHLHAKGVLHCDLKPGNVLLDQDGKPRVADFGQSRLRTEETPALGTLFYMAPQQADLDAVPDASWDVYGLGAILFSMLTGKPPYYTPALANQIEVSGDVDSRLKTYRESLLAAPPPTEHRGVAGVDRALADIIDRCIAANPKKRFNSIQSLLLALRQRQISKARRPLMVLGLLGPLLLVGVASLFGWWAFRQAVHRTTTEITRKSIESNQFAAQLAARSAAEQIDEYFRVVGQLSRDKLFLQTYDRVIGDEALLEMRRAIADPSENRNLAEDSAEAIGPIRHEFRNHAIRGELQPFLEDRLNNNQGDFPVAASWFVCDRFGNQIASAFRNENRTLGNNFSYRTYFTGLDSDLKTAEGDFEVSDQLDQRRIINTPHLSAVFSSQQSNTWKIAFSAPIVRGGKVAGIVAVTVDLGNLIEFDNLDKHYAMMVDTRKGENRGVILEHPLFQEVLRDNEKVPDELAKCKVDLGDLKPSDQLSDQFIDPVGKTAIGEALGYDRAAVIAVANVMMQEPDVSRRGKQKAGRNTPLNAEGKRAEKNRMDTGLVVLAVEDHEGIVAPAIDLGRQLGILARLAAFFLVLVTIVIWMIVNRMLDESRQRLERAFSPSSESGSGLGIGAGTAARGDQETLPAS